MVKQTLGELVSGFDTETYTSEEDRLAVEKLREILEQQGDGTLLSDTTETSEDSEDSETSEDSEDTESTESTESSESTETSEDTENHEGLTEYQISLPPELIFSLTLSRVN